MTTLTNKFQEISKQFQQLTIWRPNERDPLVELDRWRTDAHLTIEQIYNKKKYRIEQLCEKHEREFLRQLARLRLSLNNIRKKLFAKKENNTHVRAFNENSILSELHKIENDINIRLGRAEIVVETLPVNCEDLITVNLKTYLSSTSLMYSKDLSTKNQLHKSPRRSANEAQRSYDKWIQAKNDEQVAIQKELSNRRQRAVSAHEQQISRRKQNDEAYERWFYTKESRGVFTKKKLNLTTDAFEQETNETETSF